MDIRTINWIVRQLLPAVVVILLVNGCTTIEEAPPSAHQGMAPNAGPVAESDLLDVSVIMFDFPELTEEDLRVQRTDTIIQAAEAHYMAHRLARTLAHSGNWGTVHTLPEDLAVSEVVVSADILYSSSDRLTLQLTVSDCRGAQWLTKRYTVLETDVERTSDTMLRVMCERIATDLDARGSWFSPAERGRLQQISQLKLAGQLMPDPYADYLSTNGDGLAVVRHLPSENDPVFRRIERISARLAAFTDVVGDHYSAYDKSMHADYRLWRDTLRHSSHPILRTQQKGFMELITAPLRKMTHQVPEWEQKFVDDTVSSYAEKMSPIVLEFEGELYTLYTNKDEYMNQWRRLLERISGEEIGIDPRQNTTRSD